MKLWWITDSVRVGREKAAIEALLRDEKWFAIERWTLFDGKFAVEGAILAHGIAYSVRLLYPDQFPEVPAWVEPKDPAAKWSSHQYGPGGSLCLELRPDNWVMEATGADVLRSAYHLLAGENPLGEKSERCEVPSAHNVGAIQAYDYSLNPVFIGARCHDRILEGSAHELNAFQGAYRDDVWPFVVHDLEDRQGARRPPANPADTIECRILVSTQTPPAVLKTREELITAAGFGDEAAELIATSTHVLVLFVGIEESWAFQVLAKVSPVRRRVVVLPASDGYRSARAAESAKKCVAIVGAGSIGSKISETLARSGVSRFVLADGDVLLPDNLERHALDWSEVGHRKVCGLKRRIQSIVPGALVDVIDENFNWQRSAKTHAWQVSALAECDLIVDATGDAATALFLGAIAAANGKPFVSIEVFEGGIGALVASYVPERDAIYARSRAAFLAWCEQQPNKPPPSHGRRYEALADDGTPFVADDAAVTVAAGQGGRVILDILDGKPAAREAAWLLIGLSAAWIFNGHGHTIRLDPGAPQPQQAALVDEEARSFALAVAAEALGENSRSA
jgi:hypothetical protein